MLIKKNSNTINIFTDLLEFIKKPSEDFAENQTIKEKLRKLLVILALDISLMALLMSLLAIIQQFSSIDFGEHKMYELIKTTPKNVLIFIVVVMVPIIEELVFRLYLKYKNNYLLRFIVLLVSVFGTKNKEKVKSFFTNIYKTKFKLILYFSALLFAVVHIFNYEKSLTVLLFTPLLVAPQFVMGLLLGYLRVKHGVVLGMLLHALHNAVFILIPIVFMAVQTAKTDFSTSNYTLTITENTKKSETQNRTYNSKSIVFENVNTRDGLEFLLGINRSYITCTNKSFFMKKINVHYKNENGENAKNKTLVLDALKEKYGFNIIKDTVFTNVWELSIVDSLLLNKFKMDTVVNKTSFSSSLKKVKIENMGLNVFCHTLSRSTNEFIMDATGNKSKYNLELLYNNFEELESKLKNEYGLILKPSKDHIILTKIDL